MSKGFMSIEQLLIQYSPYIFLVYIVTKEFAPIFGRILEHIIPAKLAKSKSLEEKALELEERKLDITEREVVAKEQVNTLLALIRQDLDNNRVDHQTIIRALTESNSALHVLLDRSIRIRSGDGIQGD